MHEEKTVGVVVRVFSGNFANFARQRALSRVSLRGIRLWADDEAISPPSIEIMRLRKSYGGRLLRRACAERSEVLAMTYYVIFFISLKNFSK